MDFEYGAAMWSQGTEGAYREDGKEITTLEKYAELYPNRMQENYPPFKTLDLYHNYEAFVEQLNELQLDSIRTSVSWSRLIPNGKDINQKAVDFYINFFQAIRETGTKIWITLYWFDMPIIQEDKGGFLSEEVRNDFVYYCTNAIKLFEQYIDIFFIYNEPQVDLGMKYLYTVSYPFEIDLYKNYQSQIYMLECQAEVISKAKEMKLEKKIGTVINICKVHARSYLECDQKAKNYNELFDYKPWLDTSINGKYPIEFIDLLKANGINLKLTDDQKNLFAENRIEVLGVNYYYPQRVKVCEYSKNPNAPLMPSHFYSKYDMPGKKMNQDRGWEIYPRGIYEILMDIKNDYGNIESYITENGIGVQGEKINENGVVDDQYRIDFIKESLEQCKYAINDGANLQGYHVWSVVDLWSPSNQFLNKYGLIHFDDKSMSFKLKKSGEWYRELIIKSNSNEFR